MIVTPIPSSSSSITGKRNPNTVVTVDEVEVAFELFRSKKDNVHNFGEAELLRFGERAIPYLIQGLGSQENWWVRRSSTMMLNTLTQQGVNTEKAVPTLVEALNDKEINVVVCSSATLVGVGAKSVPVLLETLNKNPYQRGVNHGWHWRIVNALGEIKEGARDAVDHLNLILHKEKNNLDLSFYDLILHTLQRIGGRRAIKIIEEQALKDQPKDSPTGTLRNTIAIKYLAEIALSKYEDPTSNMGVIV